MFGIMYPALPAAMRSAPEVIRLRIPARTAPVIIPEIILPEILPAERTLPEMQDNKIQIFQDSRNGVLFFCLNECLPKLKTPASLNERRCFITYIG